jgi:putative aldouronate transport system substrate-binding protein
MKKALLVALALLLVAGASFASGQDEAAGADGPRELTIWEGLWYNSSVSVASLDETPLYQEVQRRTGIDVTWIHPPQGQEEEQFNLMIASNDLPDMIYWDDWVNNYPGGPEKAISDGVIIKLNEVMEEHAPNLTGLFQENPSWYKSAKTDNGTLYMFPFIRGADDLMVFFGPQLRRDWLDQLGLDVPETLGEWEEVLVAFKEAGLSEYPLTFTRFDRGRGINGPGNAFIQPFGTTWEFHQVDGKAVFGPYEDEYLDFLTYFKGWFDRGLVDPEFFSNERNTFDAKILNGEVGAWTSYTGSGIGAYLDANAGKGTFDIIAAPYPVVSEGETPFFGQRDNPLPGQGMAITTQAEDVALCAEFADYAYGDEGHVLYNFGIEGESYEWTTEYEGFEGERWPEYTEIVTNDPDGRTLAQMGGLYTRAFYSGPIVQDRRYIYQYARRPAQREAIQIWSRTDAEEHKLPVITATPEEAEELAEIMSEVETYREEMFVKFITGQEPLSNFDEFQARLKQMGIERAVAIKQAGLDRFNAR